MASLRTLVAPGVLRGVGLPDVTFSVSMPSYPQPTIPPGTPVVEYSTLYRVGDTDINAGLNRLTTPSIVHFNPGLYEIVDFKTATAPAAYGVLALNCLGIIGSGVDKTVFQMRPGSSTKASFVPKQSAGGTNQLYLMRLSKSLIVCRDFTLAGTDQPTDPNTGLPHLFNGFFNYITTGAQFYNIKISGVPGDATFPPGETFGFNCYKDTNTVITYMEVDGYTWTYTNTGAPDGTLARTRGSHRGGSPLGHNNSKNVKEYGCNFHDGIISTHTSSYSGAPTDINAVTSGVETYWCTSANNGQNQGWNHENTYGRIFHDHPTTTLNNIGWTGNHMLFDSRLGDNPDITINEPTWTNGHANYNGMFIIRIHPQYDGVTNTQTTIPKVIKNGIQLTPVNVSSQPTGLMTQSPNQYFVVVRA
ncbi:hypothetical protein [Leifsonia sp. 1010]|uniref:hypothetical protein n=1 Tax=Leifsonia sp. 1010 TaxID=2817769 RepID=UPI002857130D|nr:hypothetical protein [Leifsonia sp. 1010]MDR6613599.1 hypothetical protein [Leifsonia sp. 1010]